jgi:hypothetical protein
MEEQTFDPIAARREEVAQYDANIAMYTAIFAGLPHDWPAHLEQYRGAKNQQATVDQLEDLEDVVLLSQLWYADECHKAIRTETLERTKAAAILAALEAQV